MRWILQVQRSRGKKRDSKGAYSAVLHSYSTRTPLYSAHTPIYSACTPFVLRLYSTCTPPVLHLYSACTPLVLHCTPLVLRLYSTVPLVATPEFFAKDGVSLSTNSSSIIKSKKCLKEYIGQKFLKMGQLSFGELSQFHPTPGAAITYSPYTSLVFQRATVIIH